MPARRGREDAAPLCVVIPVSASRASEVFRIGAVQVVAPVFLHGKTSGMTAPASGIGIGKRFRPDYSMQRKRRFPTAGRERHVSGGSGISKIRSESLP